MQQPRRTQRSSTAMPEASGAGPHAQRLRESEVYLLDQWPLKGGTHNPKSVSVRRKLELLFIFISFLKILF